MCSASTNDDPRVDIWGKGRQLLNQCVREDVLRDRDTDGTTQSVEEDRNGVSNGHVLFVKDDLHSNKRYLYAGARTDTSQDLVTDPDARRRRGLESVEEATSDGEYGASNPHWRVVRPDHGDAGADHD